MYLLRILQPKSTLSWLILLAFGFMFGVAIGPKLIQPKGVLLLLAVLAGVAGVQALVPARWFIRFECLPFWLRVALLGFPAYAFVVTLGHFAELYSFRAWMEFVLITTHGAVPFSAVHATGVAAALYIWSAQRYVLWFPSPKDQETILSGQQTISHHEAQQRSSKLFRH